MMSDLNVSPALRDHEPRTLERAALDIAVAALFAQQRVASAGRDLEAVHRCQDALSRIAALVPDAAFPAPRR